MKLFVTMKCPDALDLAIKDGLIGCCGEDCYTEENYENEREIKNSIKDICKKWFKYGETVVLEIDTNLMTCKVKEN